MVGSNIRRLCYSIAILATFLPYAFATLTASTTAYFANNATWNSSFTSLLDPNIGYGNVSLSPITNAACQVLSSKYPDQLYFPNTTQYLNESQSTYELLRLEQTGIDMITYPSLLVSSVYPGAILHLLAFVHSGCQ